MSDITDDSLLEDMTPDNPDLPAVEFENNDDGQEDVSPDKPSAASREDVADIVTRALAAQKTTAEPPKPQMTEAEIQKALNVAQFDDQFATQLHQALHDEEFEPRKVLDIVHSMRDKLINQATTYTQLAFQKLQQDMEAKLQPLLEQTRAQTQAAVQDRFFRSYKGLQPYKELLPVAAQNIVNQQKTFTSEAEEFKAVAKEAERLIKTVNSQFSLGQAKGGEPKPSSALRGGSRGGSGQPAAVRTGADPSIV